MMGSVVGWERWWKGWKLSVLRGQSCSSLVLLEIVLTVSPLPPLTACARWGVGSLVLVTPLVGRLTFVRGVMARRAYERLFSSSWIELTDCAPVPDLMSHLVEAQEGE